MKKKKNNNNLTLSFNHSIDVYDGDCSWAENEILTCSFFTYFPLFLLFFHIFLPRGFLLSSQF